MLNDFENRKPRNKSGASHKEGHAAMLGKTGGEYVTIYEAEKMIAEFLETYERKIVEPRDQRNRETLAEIKELATSNNNVVMQGSGALKLAGVMLTLASTVWLITQIVHAIKT